jgi:LysM repeat protein
MAVFDPRDGRVSGSGEAARRIAQDRAAELARGAALAQALPAALAATEAGAVSRLAQLLAQIGSLTAEGRGAFLAAVRLPGGPAVSDPGAELRRRFEARYPPDSMAREALGVAVGRLGGRAVRGDEAQALAAELIARATGGEAPRSAKPAAQPVRDAVEVARPATLFEAAHKALASSSAAQGSSASPTTPTPTFSPAPAAAASVRAPGTPDVRSSSAMPATSPPAPAWLRVTTPDLEGVAGRLTTIHASILRARGTLAAQVHESLRVQYGLRAAARGLEAVEAHAVAAEERLVQAVLAGRSPKGVLAGLAAAQGDLRAIARPAADAREALVEVSGQARYTDVRATLREVDVVARESVRVEAELGLVEGRTAVLADAATGLSVSSTSTPVPAQPAVSGGLTEDDLRLLGSGLTAGQTPPQIQWTEAAVNTACERARAQGGVTEAEGQAHFDLAGRLLEGASGPVALGAADLAAALKEAGIALEKVDPQQLEAAARYVSAAAGGTDQRDRLRKALDGFQTLARIGAPRLTRQEMIDQLWGAARVPGHALQKLSDAEIARTLQQVSAAVNGGPGEHQLKVGSYNLKFTVGASGELASSSCQKPGFFSKLGSALKKVAPIALTVASFIPATAAFARIAQGAISLAKSIRSKSLLGGLTSAASIVGGGVAAFAGKAVGVAGTAANKVAAIANGASKALQGVSSLKQGSVLGGLAATFSGMASGIASFAKAAGDGLNGVAAKLRDVSTGLAQAGQAVSAVESYRSAGRAVSEAQAALRQAEATGDKAAIAAAREQLARAESAKTSAVLGSVAQAASLAADVRAGYARQPGEAVSTPGAKVTLDVALRTAWRGLNVARAVHDRDYAAAGVSALGLAAVGRQATGAEPSAALGLTDAANMADAALGYHEASRGEDAANAAVADAERALRAARLGGDAGAIRQAEANLQQARKAREGALMGAVAAGETLLATAEAIGQKLRASRTAASASATPELEEQARKEIDRAVATWQEADEVQQRWAAQAADETASPEVRAAAAAGIEALQRAKAAYDRALEEARGDPARLRAATGLFQGVRQGIAEAVARASAGPPTTRTAAGPASTGFASLRQPEKVGKATVRPGSTVWELSQRTGVAVERILDFNARMGQPIDPDRLKVGQEILVPLGAADVTFRPKTAEEVQRMVDEAELEKRLASMPAPTFHSGEVPLALGPADPRERALALLENDRALVAEDERSSRFSLISPSTWVDTKAEEARYAAREAFSQAVDRYEGLLRDPGTSLEALRAAETDKLRALNAYNEARGVTDRAAATANYLTPLTELTEKGQEALHDPNRGVRTAMADTLTKAGVPAALVGAATLPSHVFDSVVDLDAGFAKGVVQLADGMAGIVAHPVQTGQGVAVLIDRAAQATPQGRALELLFETAYGKYDSPQELLAAYQDRTNPLAVAKAQVELAADIGRGMFAESIRLAGQGKYEEAVGTALGQNVDMVFGAGMVGKGRKVRAAVDALEDAGAAARATGSAGKAAEAAARAGDTAGDALRGLGEGLETEVRAATEAASDVRQKVVTAGRVEGTPGGGAADKIAAERSTEYTREVPSVVDGRFAQWFNSLSSAEFKVLWKDARLREVIKARLRSPGGFHEWLPVARADVYRRWGVTADEIAALRTPTREVRFIEPAGAHGAIGSGAVHNEIIRMVDQSLTFEEFARALCKWADERLPGGSDALPSGFRSHKTHAGEYP